MKSEKRYYPLCATEIGVVLIGVVNMPAATIIQILGPFLIFSDLIFRPHAYHRVLFIACFMLSTILFTTSLFYFENTFLPLLIIVALTLFSMLTIRVAENCIQRHFIGVP